MYKLTLSFLFTSLGHWLTMFIIPVIVLYITNDAFLVALVLALDTLPFIIFTPFSGVLGDKFNRKWLIQISEFISLTAVVILFIVPFEKEHLYLIIGLSFIVSSLSAMHHPVFNSIIPDVVKSKDFKKINGNIATIGTVNGVIAPALIGTLLLTLDPKQATISIIICYLLSFLCISFIKYEYKKIDHQNKSVLTLLKEGAIFVLQHKELRNYSILFFLMVFGLNLVTSNVIWIYSNFYGLKNFAYYYIVTGALSILGAQVASRFIVDRFNAKLTIKWANLIMAFVALLFFLTKPSPLLLALVLGLMQFFNMFIVVSYFTYRQKVVDSSILSRVVSITRLVSFLAAPIGSLLGGYIIEKTSNINIIYGMSFIMLLLAYFIFSAVDKRSIS